MIGGCGAALVETSSFRTPDFHFMEDFHCSWDDHERGLPKVSKKEIENQGVRGKAQKRRSHPS